jgi:hypothetical protein
LFECERFHTDVSLLNPDKPEVPALLQFEPQYVLFVLGPTDQVALYEVDEPTFHVWPLVVEGTVLGDQLSEDVWTMLIAEELVSDE